MSWILLLLTITFPIISLYSHNVSETTITEIIPVLAFQTTPLLVIFIFTKIRYSFENALVLIFLINSVSLLYGNISLYLEKYIGQIPSYRDFQLIPGVILLIVYLFQLLKNNRIFPKIIKIYLLVNLSFSLLCILKFHLTLVQNQIFSHTDNEFDSMIDQAPDIYYFILDEFASSETMINFYNYDNRSFEEKLSNLGFDIIPNSYSSFSSTWPNLASILNQNKADSDLPPTSLYNQIIDSKISRNLKKLGYKYVYISDQKLYYGSYKNPFSDLSLFDYKNDNQIDTGSNFNNFTEMYLKSSILRILVSSDKNNIYRENELLKHKMLESVVNNEQSPKFVFLHSMITHQPFLFDQYGNSVDYSKQLSWDDKSVYLGSYIYATNTIINNIENILSSNKNSVIIVQSDHGPRHPAMNNEWRKIFNAVYLPNNKKLEHPIDFENIKTFDYIFNSIDL